MLKTVSQNHSIPEDLYCRKYGQQITYFVKF